MQNKPSESTMTKYTLSYLAGALTITVTVFMAHGNGTLIAFGMGVFTVMAIAFALLASPAKLRRAGLLLARIADAVDGHQTTMLKRSARPTETTAAVAPAAHQVSQLEEEVVSALVNFRVPKKRAELAARRAMEQTPAGDFNSIFCNAVNLAKEAA
jgi:hypothetical protein